MKRLFVLVLSAVLLLSCVPAAHGAEEMEFYFELSVDGGDTKQVKPGDVITVTFYLLREDADEPYDMYAMQNEIRYDSNFFRLVEGSQLLSSGIQTTDLGLRDQFREFYMNYLSLSGGEPWPARRLVGSFQLEVIAQSGVSTITNQDYLVSSADGESHYRASCQDVTVIISTDCVVEFESNGGSEVRAQTVRYGETLSRPEDPVREGYVFRGWYSDLDLKNRWDFEEDTVQGNMTLYAKWKEQSSAPAREESFPWWIVILILLALLLLLCLGRKKVTFESGCDIPASSRRVWKGSRIHPPQTPVQPGRVFAGWYADSEGLLPWNFEQDKVKKNMTLYAKWI